MEMSYYTPNNPNFTGEHHWTPPSPSSPEGCQVSLDSSSLILKDAHFDSSHFVTYPLFNPVQDLLFPEGSCLSPISDNTYPNPGVNFDCFTGIEGSCKYRDPAYETSETAVHLNRTSSYALSGLHPQPLVCTSSAQQFSPLPYRFPPAPQTQSGDADYSLSAAHSNLARSMGVNYAVDSIPSGWNNAADHCWSFETATNAFIANTSHLHSGLGFDCPTQNKATHNGQGYINQPVYTYSPLLLEDSTLSEPGSCPDAFEEFLPDCPTATAEQKVQLRQTKTPPSSSSSKPNLCRICGKMYARPSTLKTHLRTHSGERPYRCTECNKSFSQAANLTAHVRTHSGEKPFKCHICYRRFSQSSSVTTHMRTHSGERPYRCRMCKKAFSDSSTLTKHMRIHSGEKPYQCTLCLLRFSQSGNLNRHMRVHVTS